MGSSNLLTAKFNFRHIIGLLICFWILLLCYELRGDPGDYDGDNELQTIRVEESEFTTEHLQRTSGRADTQNLKLPNMLKLMYNSPPLQTDQAAFKNICPLRRNICMQDKHWVTTNESDVFDARSSIRYCKGIICNSLHAKHVQLDEIKQCKVHKQLSIILLGQYYPHMFNHVWSRTLNGLWEYAIRSALLSRNHHFVYEQLDFENMYMFHQMLLRPFTNYPVQHYKNLILDPNTALLHMSQHSNTFNITTSVVDNNCGCVSEVYFCGFNQDFSKNYPQGFVTPNDGNYFTWDRVEWIKQYWHAQSDNDNDNDEHIEWIEEYFGKDKLKDNNKALIGLIDRRNHGKWLNIDHVEQLCVANAEQYACKIIRIYEIKRPIELLWIMDEIDILIGFHSNSLVQGGLWLPHKATIVEILPAHPIPSWMNFPGSTLQWVFRKIPQRHAWFQLYDYENQHTKDYNADKSDFELLFDELDKVIQVVLKHPNEFCYAADHHNMSIPSDLESRNFTFDIKKFDSNGALYQYKPHCSND